MGVLVDCGGVQNKPEKSSQIHPCIAHYDFNASEVLNASECKVIEVLLDNFEIK